jgi:hypothetical protein
VKLLFVCLLYSTNNIYVAVIRVEQRLRWLGHVERVPEERDVKKIYKLELIVSRPVGPLNISLMDNVMKGIQAVRIVNWEG